MLRVTQSIFHQDSVAGLQKKLQQLKRAQDTSLSGDRIMRPTDDPSGTFRHSILSSEMSKVQSIKKTTDLAVTRISLASEKLGMIHDTFLEAQELANTMGNDYQGDVTTLRSMGFKAGHMYEQLMQNINAESDGSPLFSGGRSVVPYDENSPVATAIRKRNGDRDGFVTQSSGDYTVASVDASDGNYPGMPVSVKMTYVEAGNARNRSGSNEFQILVDGDADPNSPVTFAGAPATVALGWAQISVNTLPNDGDALYFELVPEYQGGLSDPEVKITDGKTLPRNLTGEEVMEGKNGRQNNLFSAMAGLRGALLRGDSREVNAWIGQMEESRSQASDVQALSGLRQNQVEAVNATLQIEDVALQDLVAKNKEADMFDVISNMEQILQALQVMTTSERNILNVSLVDLIQ